MSDTDDRWGVIDEQSIAEAYDLNGVPLRRDRMQWNEVATADAIRQFADGVGDDNPLWRDRGYAAAAGRDEPLAPPSFLYAVDATIVAPKLPGVQWIYAGTRWRWYDVVREGDRFDVDVRFTQMEEKTGRRFGLWVLQTGEIVYRRSDGELLCVAEGRVARTPRQRRVARNDKSPSGDTGAHLEADEPRHQATASEEPRRGARSRLWESVSVGDTIGPAALELTLDRIFAWYTGAQGALHYGGAHGDGIRYRRLQHYYEINNKT